MNDKELADAVVALGVAGSDRQDFQWLYGLGGVTLLQTAENFVRDWRVAGALMEKLPESTRFIFDKTYVDIVFHGLRPNHDDSCVKRDESLPRAIIEACVAALAGERDD